MRILFCGGGTAGHVYPAIAIADEIKAREKNSEFLFIGRSGGDENGAIHKSGYRLEVLDVVGLSRKAPLVSIKALFKALFAIGEAKKIIAKFKPDIVVGTGGYVSFPVLCAARSLGIKTVIHESNAAPGLVTRLLASSCDLVLLGFSEAKEKLNKRSRIAVVGNPVRRDFSRIDRREARRRLGIDQNDFLVLSFGGSLGAERLNEVMMESIRLSIQKGHSLYFIHATGRKHYDDIAMANGECIKNKRCRIMPYIDDMPTYLSAADIAITRAGAITTAELMTTRTPAILVPSPNVSDNHQYKNAMALANMGAVLVINEKDLDKERLLNEILELRFDRRRRDSMRDAMSTLGDKECLGEIIKKIQDLAYGRV